MCLHREGEHIVSGNPLLTAMFLCGILFNYSCRAVDLTPPTTECSFEGLQFDATFEMRFEMTHSIIVLFARYWVWKDAYRVEIVWSEPGCNPQHFPCYPVSLTIRNTQSEFSVANPVIKKKSLHAKPIPPRGSLTDIAGAYDMANTRFLEGEAAAYRVYAKDITDFSGAETETFVMPVEGGERSIGSLAVDFEGDLLCALTLLDEKGEEQKTINYFYMSDDGKNILKKQEVTLFESRIMAGNSETVVKRGDRQEMYTQVPLTYHKGNRNCVVMYDRIEISGRQATLPVSIETRAGNVLLRRVVFSKYRSLDSADRDLLESAEPSSYSTLSDDELLLQVLLGKYWLAESNTVSPEDKETLGRLETEFSAWGFKEGTVGERLRRLYMLAMVEMMLDNTESLARLFDTYIAVLKESGIRPGALLYGGRDFIRLAIRWDKLELADQAMLSWLETSKEIEDTSEIIEFARMEMLGKYPWTTYRLLDTLLQRTYDASPRFHIQYLMCGTLGQLVAEYSTSPKKRDIKGSYHPTQVFESPKALMDLLANTTENTMYDYSSIAKPSKDEEQMKAMIENEIPAMLNSAH